MHLITHVQMSWGFVNIIIHVHIINSHKSYLSGELPRCFSGIHSDAVTVIISNEFCSPIPKHSWRLSPTDFSNNHFPTSTWKRQQTGMSRKGSGQRCFRLDMLRSDGWVPCSTYSIFWQSNIFASLSDRWCYSRDHKFSFRFLWYLLMKEPVRLQLLYRREPELHSLQQNRSLSGCHKTIYLGDSVIIYNQWKSKRIKANMTNVDMVQVHIRQCCMEWAISHVGNTWMKTQNSFMDTFVHRWMFKCMWMRSTVYFLTFDHRIYRTLDIFVFSNFHWLLQTLKRQNLCRHIPDVHIRWSWKLIVKNCLKVCFLSIVYE